MNSLELFNEHYLKDQSFNHLSLNDFFTNVVKEKIPENSKILDLGCGVKSIFEDRLYQNVLALDFSLHAIEFAQKRMAPNISYKQFDLRNPWKEASFLDHSFDLIFDSHCTHCVLDKEERENLFLTIKDHLLDNGLFAGEIMISSGSYDLEVPFKFCPSAYTLEQELLSYGFKIKYFVIAKTFGLEADGVITDIARVLLTK